jgi:hypothetical protein
MPKKTSGAKAAGRSLYSVHPGVAMVQNWIARLPEKTGKPLDEWLRIVRQAGPPAESERRDWLKKQHGFGTNEAWWIAERSHGKGGEDGDPEEYLKAAANYVEEMYSGPKTALRPLYDRLLKLGLGLGPEAKACPCKTIVPLYRRHVFAEIKPTTQTRIDLGLALGKLKKKPPKRVEDTGGQKKGNRITHRIPISSLTEIDDEVVRWLRVAYDLDA